MFESFYTNASPAIQYPIDRLTFDKPLINKNLQSLMKREDVSKKKFKEVVEYINAKVTSSKEGQQLQDIILQDLEPSLCGCLGPSEGNTLCPCALRTYTFSVKYHLYKHFKDIAESSTKDEASTQTTIGMSEY